MSERDGSKRRVLTPDERVLWTMVTRSIAPIREDAVPDEAKAIAEKAQPLRAQKQGPQLTLTKSAPPALTPLSRRARRSVARRAHDIDARLDLHGLTQSEAHAALLRFLRSASARGARLVLVITGKGGRGDGERGVLKRQVPQWLALPEFRAFVIGFDDAHIAHGGEGALYVRIRRQRH
ncbi:MAG TPA: Smr/MutS family protein [Pseudolabrys sp.]|jgi:DNA-nicking Smr family endonuclease|nr:Smr/MutS family protein [Pseudolabrys sp.]